MSVGNRIRLIRGDVSRPKFSELCDVSRNTLVNYETGVSSPNADFLAAVCERFNVDPGWLLTGKGSMQPGGTMHGQGIKDYPEVGAEDVLEAVTQLAELLEEVNGTIPPSKLAVSVRLVVEILAEEARKSSGQEESINVVSLEKIRRVISLAS